MDRVIKLLMISDILLLTGFGFVQPILAIFFKEDLVGGSILMAGIAGAVFLIVKSFIQLPFSKYVDSHGYATRIRWLIIGTFFIAIVPFMYIMFDHIYWIIFAQVVRGIGSGLAYPTWLGLWSTHLDKKKESFEWSLYSTLVGIGTAASAAIGAGLAEWLGFDITFIIVGGIWLFGCVILFALDKRNNKMGLVLGMNYHKKRKLIGKPY